MAKHDVKAALSGISGVHITPYDSNGAIDRRLLGRLVGRIAQAGVHAVVAGGNTGEFYTLTGEEIRVVHDAAIAGNDGRAVLIAALGRSLTEAVALGRRAAEAGADAVMVHQPTDPFMAPGAQADYFRAIAEALPLPVIAYVRSDTLGVADIMAVADHPNVIGVKFATQNLMCFAECVRASGPDTAQWVCGLAESWAGAFYAVGARGFTSGLVNVAPERSLAIHAALDAGRYDEANRQVAEIAAFEEMRARYNSGSNVTVVKAALEMTGFPVGPVRLPGLPRLSEAEQRELAGILGRWGLPLAA